MTNFEAVSKSRIIVVGGSKPLLIWIAPWLLIPWVFGALAFTVVVLANWGEGTLVAAGTTITSVGQLSVVLPFFLAWTIVILAGCIGLYRERRWARPVIGLVPVCLAAGWGAAVLVLSPSVTSNVVFETILPPFAQSLVVAWYMYGYSTVRQYYHQLDDAHRFNSSSA